MENEMTYEEIINTLRLGIVNLSFTKVKDGAVREMRATLVEDYIPVEKMPKTDSNANTEKNQVAVRVFDLDVADWRSFRVDSLLTFTAV
jgi:hypothetical protein|tara:strand:- start:2019 stop:2285 length:267 start_codon:yes stop_codon:yes gene_type:complete